METVDDTVINNPEFQEDCSGDMYDSESEIVVIVIPMMENNKLLNQASIQLDRQSKSSNKIELKVSEENTNNDEYENIDIPSRNNIGLSIRSNWRKIRESAHTPVEKPVFENKFPSTQHRHREPQPYHSIGQSSGQRHIFSYPITNNSVFQRPVFMSKMSPPTTPTIDEQNRFQNNGGFRLSPTQRVSSSPTPIKPSTPPIPPKLVPFLLKEPEILTKHILRNNVLKPGLYQIVRPMIKPQAFPFAFPLPNYRKYN